MKQLLIIAKYLTAIGVIGGAMLGGFKIYSAVLDTNEMIEYVNVEQSFMATDIAGIKDTLEIIQDQAGSNKSEITALKQSYIDYVKRDESLTKEEFIDIMEEMWDVKKNSYLPPNDLINYENITASENLIQLSYQLIP